MEQRRLLHTLLGQTGAESIKESSTLAISTLYLGGEGRDHTCAVSDVPSRVELSSFIDSALEQHPLFLNPRLWSEFDRNKIKILRNPSEFNYALQQYLLSYFCIALYCTV